MKKLMLALVMSFVAFQSANADIFDTYALGEGAGNLCDGGIYSQANPAAESACSSRNAQVAWYSVSSCDVYRFEGYPGAYTLFTLDVTCYN